MENMIAQTLTFHKDFGGLYSSYRLAGHRGSVNITNKLFPGGVPPATIEVIGLVPAQDVPTVDEAAREAAKAQKLQEKATAAQAKAEARASKAQAIAEKARAAADAAVAKAAAAAAAAGQTAEEAEEDGEEPVEEDELVAD